MFKFSGKFERFTHYFVEFGATGVDALFLKSFKKIAAYMFKMRGGVNGRLNNVQKNFTIRNVWLGLRCLWEVFGRSLLK